MAVSFDSEGHITDDEAIALVEKRVSPGERRRIDAHLDVCDMCRELVAAMAMAASIEDSFGPVIALEDSSGLESVITHDTRLDESMPTQIYASLPPSADGAGLDDGDLVGHFRILRALGRGAMGEVYLARDTMLGRKVALKVIAADLLGSKRAMRRFLFEAKATARFNHPNIVTIHAVGQHGDRPFVALEYVEGENLRERTKTEKLPLPEVLRIGLAIAEALSEAHAEGILHRDLKPANIIIGRDGRVRLLDFGLAKAVQAVDEDEPSSTSTSSSTWLVGTPRYMAPEQWRGGSIEGTADVFALGVILFELCSGGTRPFPARNTVELLRVVTSPDPAPPLASVAEVPKELSRLVAKCLSKTAAERPSAKQVAEGLRGILHPERSSLLLAESPFRGLLPFTERQAAMFFGRDAEIAAFLERLRIQPVLPVIGRSGAGKTSLIQAGVIPRLRELGGWVVLQLRPGPRPFETLASRLERRDSGVFSFDVPTVESGRGVEGGRVHSLQEVEARAEVLKAAPRRLSVMLRELADAEEAKVLLFVDQLEEVFTMVDEAEQRRFLEAVCTAADDANEPVRVVLSLRHDFVDRLSTEGDLGRALSRFMVLRAPDEDALRQILEEPADRVGYRFEDTHLVDQMIAAVQGEPACLPLIQFAAAQLWDLRDEDRKLLLRSAYDAMGGVGGALAQHADSVLDALPAEQRRIARTLLLRLVTPERTRRIIPSKTALDGLGAQAETVLKHLTEARLVGVSKLRRGDDHMLELAHQSLIHAWRTLADWIEHSEDELRSLGEATQAAELWDKRGRRVGELWGDDALHDIDRALARATTEVPALVTAFLDESRRHGRRRTRRKRIGLAASASAFALVATIGVVVFIWISRTERAAELARQEALQHEREAREQQARLLVQGARKALEEGFPLDARAQVRRALELRDSAAARSLWQKLSSEPAAMRRRLGLVNYGLAVSPDGETIAVASHDGRIYLVNSTTGTFRHLDGHADAVSSVAFTGDGAALISSDLEGNVVYWELRTESPRSLRRLDKGNVWSLAISPDNRHVAAAGQFGLRVLDVQTGDVRSSLSDEPAHATVYASDGAVIVLGGSRGLHFFDASTGGAVTTLEEHGAVEALSVAPDGKRIAAATEGGPILLVDAASGAIQSQLSHPSRASAVTFGPHGKRLAAVGADGTTLVFDVPSGEVVARHDAEHRLLGAAFYAGGERLALVGDDELLVIRPSAATRPRSTRHRGVVHDVRFAPDGKTLASAGFDGTVRVWSLASGRVLHVLRGHSDKVWRIAYAPDGDTLATASFDGTVRLWDARAGLPQRVLGGHENAVSGVSFRPDGEVLASCGADHTVRLWSVETGAQLRVMRGHEQPVTEVTFNPAGDMLASSSVDETLRLWPTIGAETVLRGHGGAVATLAFDSDGERLVSASSDKTIRVWSVPPARGEPTVVDDSAGRVQRVAFHPDGQRVAVARSNGKAQILAVGAGVASELVGHDGGVNTVQFDRTGAFAASAGDDGSVRVWDMSTGQPFWRGVALIPAPPRALTHRDWQPLDGAESAQVDDRWARRVADHARYATQAIAGGPVCILTHDGGFEAWRVADDTRVYHFEAEIEDLIALPTGCAARSVGAVHLISQAGTRRELAIGGAPLAMGWGEQRLLVATKSEVLAFSESGDRIGQHQHGVGAVAALTQIGSQLVIAHPKRSITLVGTSPEEPPSVARFERASQAAPIRMAAGPRNTLVAGYRDGTLALFDTVDGALLLREELHGSVTHLLTEDDRLYVVTELGDTLTWDLRFLTQDYCELLRTVWQSLPVVWEQGEPKVRPAPDGHICR